MPLFYKEFQAPFVIMDDILVTGATEEEHLRNLEEVFRRLQAHGIWVKKGKCRFLHDSVDYLGHRVDAEGLRPLPDKVEAGLHYHRTYIS